MYNENMKARLTQLLLTLPKRDYYVSGVRVGKALHTAETIAEHLIDNGVIVLPCKVGDTVYHFSRDLGAVFPYFVETLSIGSIGKNKTYWNYEANFHDEETDELIDEIDFDIDDIGKTVFLTREEAERAREDYSESDKLLQQNAKSDKKSQNK